MSFLEKTVIKLGLFIVWPLLAVFTLASLTLAVCLIWIAIPFVRVKKIVETSKAVASYRPYR